MNQRQVPRSLYLACAAAAILWALARLLWR
jgi:hypothetical protein